MGWVRQKDTCFVSLHTHTGLLIHNFYDLHTYLRDPHTCVKVMDAVLADPTDKTKLSLVYANVSEADIILKVGV